MPVVLALLVAFLTGFFSSPGLLWISQGDARAKVVDVSPGIEREPLAETAWTEKFRPDPPDRRASIAMLSLSLEDAEEVRETEEDEHIGRAPASFLISHTLWNGPSHHAWNVPDPSRLPRSRHLFLLCGHLLC